MDSVHKHLKKAMRGRVVVPRSIPGLVTKRVLVMDYLRGVPLTKLGSRMKNIPPRMKPAASERV